MLGRTVTRPGNSGGGDGPPPKPAESRPRPGAWRARRGKRKMGRQSNDALQPRETPGATASQVWQEPENDERHGANKPLLGCSTCGLTPELSRAAKRPRLERTVRPEHPSHNAIDARAGQQRLLCNGSNRSARNLGYTSGASRLTSRSRAPWERDRKAALEHAISTKSGIYTDGQNPKSSLGAARLVGCDTSVSMLFHVQA